MDTAEPDKKPDEIEKFGSGTDMKRVAQPDELSPADSVPGRAELFEPHQRHRAAGEGVGGGGVSLSQQPLSR